MNYPTKYWHVLPNGKIQCDLCPRFCKLQKGQRGNCYVRMCENNQIVLTAFGRSSGFCIDPIEKKPFNHFLPGSSVFSFGTAGCNLCCKFCQNWNITKSGQTDVLSDQATPEHIANKAAELECQSVAFTYNEPTVFMEYAIEVAKACHNVEIKTVAVTNGYINPEPRKEFFSYMDGIRVDLKSITEKFYQKITSGHLAPVLDTIKYIKHETNAWLEIICLLITGENDSPEELEALTNWVIENVGIDVPLHFTAFFPAYKMLATPPTSIEKLIEARNIAIKNGLRYVYTGNVYHPEGNNTHCHNCNNLLISRENYYITAYNLDENGKCKFCQTKCAGVFSKTQGNFGGQRKPIWMSES